MLLARRALGVDTAGAVRVAAARGAGLHGDERGALWRRGARTAGTLVPPEWVVGFLVELNVAQIVRMDFGHVPVVRAIVPLVLAGGFVSMVAFVAWRSVSALAAPRAGEPGKRPMPPAPPARPATSAPASTRPRRPRCWRASIRRSPTGDSCARPDLTLGLLATAAGSTAHQVSEALNRFRGVTFHELVNRHRVDDVKAQLWTRKRSLHHRGHRRFGRLRLAFGALRRVPSGLRDDPDGVPGLARADHATSSRTRMALTSWRRAPRP